MNQNEASEIKVELYFNRFSKFCREEAEIIKVPQNKREEFLAVCIVRMSKISNKVQKAGVKP